MLQETRENYWKQKIFEITNHPYIPPLVLMIGLLGSLLISAYIYFQTLERERIRFEADVQTTTEAIASTLDNYIALLDAEAGYFAAENTQVTLPEFFRFADRLNLHKRYPGVQGIGLSVKVNQEHKATFEQEMKRKWGENFAIRPTYDRSEYHSIVFLAPLDKRNQAALGFDMFSEPVRHEAMVRARDSGEAALSGKVTLIQEIDEHKQAGFLIYVPIYHYPGIPETVEKRQQYLYGYAYSPFRAGDLFSNISINKLTATVKVSVYDGERVDDQALLYKTPANEAQASHTFSPHFVSQTTIPIAGRTWTLVVDSNQNLITASQYRNPAFVLLGGLLFSFSLYSLSRIQYRAQQNANKAEKKLSQRLAMQATIAHLGEKALLNTALPTMFKVTVTHLTHILGVEFAKVLEYVPVKKRFILRAGDGWRPSVKVNETTVPANRDSQAGYTIRVAEPVIVHDLPSETRFSGPALLTSHQVRSGISVVIYGKDQSIYGVLAAHSTISRTFTKDDVEYIQSLANILSLLIQRRQIETEREKYEHQKDEFIAVASHELKTPITSIKAFGQVLKHVFENERSEKALRVLAKLNYQVDKLTFLVNSLLDISKIEAGKLEFSYTWFDYDAMIKEVVETLQLTTQKHTLVIKGLIKTKIYADKERVEQVLTNLVNNAIKYSPQRGEIQVVVTRKEQYVRTCIKDFGIGMQETEYPKIFQRFYRVAGEERQTFSGLGLGLYIAAQIIERLQGTITVTSEPGNGSVFCFNLPIDQRDITLPQ